MDLIEGVRGKLAVMTVGGDGRVGLVSDRRWWWWLIRRAPLPSDRLILLGAQ